MNLGRVDGQLFRVRKMFLALEADGPVQDPLDVIDVDVVVEVFDRQKLALAELAAGRRFPVVVVFKMSFVSETVWQEPIAAWTAQPSFGNYILEKNGYTFLMFCPL